MPKAFQSRRHAQSTRLFLAGDKLITRTNGSFPLVCCTILIQGIVFDNMPLPNAGLYRKEGAVTRASHLEFLESFWKAASMDFLCWVFWGRRPEGADMPFRAASFGEVEK
jgi:hypothetical protein